MLAVDAARIYVDHGRTGTTRVRPGLRQGLVASLTVGALGVSALDWFAGTLPDGGDIVEGLTTHGVRLQLGCSVHDPAYPVDRHPSTSILAGTR